MFGDMNDRAVYARRKISRCAVCHAPIAIVCSALGRDTKVDVNIYGYPR